MKNIKINKKMVVILSLLSVVVCLVTWLYVSKTTDEKIAAHPINPIILDDGLGTEYKVLPDASKLLEAELKAQTPKYDDYLQGEDIVPTIEKVHIEGIASPLIPQDAPGGILRENSWTVYDVAETEAGNFAVLYGGGGTNVGGLVKLTIFDKMGKELVSYQYGDLKNVKFRPSSGFYGSTNNQFVLYPSGRGDTKTYIRFDVNENVNPIAINATQFEGNDAQGITLQSYLTYRVGGSGGSLVEDKPLIVAQIYFSNLARMGTIKGRVPIGEVNTTGWQSGTGMKTSYLTSLETDNPIKGTPLTSIKNAYINPLIAANDEGYYYGTVRYVDFSSGSTKTKSTFQVFDKVDSNIGGDKLRKKIFDYTDITSGTELRDYNITVFNNLTTDTELYFTSCEALETKLIKVDLTKIDYSNINSYKGDIIKIFPPSTVLDILKNSDGTLSYYGTTTDISDANNNEFYSEFYNSKLSSPYYYIQGIMEGTLSPEQFSVLSVKALEVDATVYPKFIRQVDTPEKDKLFVAGDTVDHTNFVDRMTYIDKDGNHSFGPPTILSRAAFSGILRIEDDYAPAMSGFEDMMLNINDKDLNLPALNSYDWRILDNWLITGTKNGNLGDAKAIKFTDVKDYENTLIGPNLIDREKYIAMRINRNINNLTADIDWKTLGFDKTYPGPQLATYFTNDSQNQATVISRWVNKITDRTVIDKEHYLDLHDFTYKLSEVSDLSDKELLKRLSRIIAWYIEEETVNGVTKKIAHEDENTLKSTPLYDHTKVTFDTDQLDTILNAKKAAPYPLDFTYKSTDENGQPVVLKNRVTVFLTDYTFDDENGYAKDPERKLAIYADDYTLPLYLAKNETKKKIFDTSDIKVYEFDKQRVTEVDGSGQPITITLADKDKLAAGDTLEPVVSYKNAFNNANYPGKKDMHVDFKGKNSKGETVELTSKFVITLIPEVLLHLRQVVLTPHRELVVPTEGYHLLGNVKLADPSQKADLQYQTVTKSGVETPLPPGFKELIVPFEFDETEPVLANQFDAIDIQTIIPEYYQYDGHIITYEAGTIHQSSAKNSTAVLWPIIDDKDHHEAWVTVYLKPTVTPADHPRPYSWDYQLNQFGEVTEN